MGDAQHAVCIATGEEGTGPDCSEAPVIKGKLSRTWQLWERPVYARPFQLSPRDIEIIHAVFRHRFLRPTHIHTLLGGSAANLALRMRLLWQHGYLERPQAQRPTKILTDEIVYGLGKKGAQLLEHLYPELRIGHLDWTETPKKRVGWPYIDHQLGIATFFVCLKIACDRAGIQLHWKGHYDHRRYEIRTSGKKYAFLPDGYFALEVPGRGTAHHFLEVDRGNISLARMQEKYRRYHSWWQERVRKIEKQEAEGKEHTFKHFRVLTVTHDRGYVDSLRRTALPIGRSEQHQETWKALMFTHMQAFDLHHPERILEPIFRYADEDTPVALVPPRRV